MTINELLVLRVLRSQGSHKRTKALLVVCQFRYVRGHATSNTAAAAATLATWVSHSVKGTVSGQPHLFQVLGLGHDLA